MSLSCSCDFDDFEWYFIVEEDYSELKTSRRKRCQSCGELISLGATVLKLDCCRKPTSDIEERIHGDEVPLANRYLCEECADLYFSVKDMNICVTFDNDKSIREMLEDYQAEKE